jgi:hypothetical protein
LETGFDLMTQEGRNLVWDIIVKQKPKVIFLAPPCTAWSQIQNINDPAVVYQKRLASVPLLNFCFQVAEYQSKHGRYFFFENPSTSNIWETKQFKAIYKLQNTTWSNTDFCMFGMRDPVSGKYYHKRVSLMFNCPGDAVARMFKHCNPANCSHEHEPVEGSCPGYGSRTKLSHVYPTSFCKAFAESMKAFLTGSAQAEVHLCSDFLVPDLLELVDSGEVRDIVNWTSKRLDTSHRGTVGRTEES